ncbi:anti-sigma-F factor Fin [Bacillus sp. 165]|uniref:anti-sigma-F factor Fin n=1 Tax=Bacillus sp. 165 TaxID=1529117 RepID=UPI001ADB7715|nr:anti-sigma-F factor Fin [Bacillus sp. 165]MBO9131303.1 DUF2757 family protein [Bacillus sp. 165]
MSAHYYCRHCGHEIGSIKHQYSVSFVLGQLSEEEQLQMTHFHEDGDLYVQAICEGCQQTLEQYPQYHQYNTFIQ